MSSPNQYECELEPIGNKRKQCDNATNGIDEIKRRRNHDDDDVGK